MKHLTIISHTGGKHWKLSERFSSPNQLPNYHELVPNKSWIQTVLEETVYSIARDYLFMNLEQYQKINKHYNNNTPLIELTLNFPASPLVFSMIPQSTLYSQYKIIRFLHLGWLGNKESLTKSTLLSRDINSWISSREYFSILPRKIIRVFLLASNHSFCLSCFSSLLFLYPDLGGYLVTSNSLNCSRSQLR